MGMATKQVEKVYEVSFHLLPTVDQDAVSSLFDRIKKVIGRGGEILSEAQPESRDLAYTVRHTVRQRDGSYGRYDASYFGSVKFVASPDFIAQVEKTLSDDEQVLRFLLLETIADDTRIGDVVPDAEEDERRATAAESSGRAAAEEDTAEKPAGGAEEA